MDILMVPPARDLRRHQPLVASINPLGGVTQFAYCKCGQLVKIIDPNGNITFWKLDGDERPIANVYADNTEVDYAYENTTSRLKTVTDAKGQQTNYSYYLDGALQGVTYTNAVNATPSVSYTYDSARGRLATMTDGIGTTAYSYYPYGTGQPGSLGAGRVQSVTGPFANETVAYQYDQLGRVIKRTVDGVDETYAFDNLDRLQTDTNALGAFTYSYDGTTSRLSNIAYPNGVQALFGYFEDNTQDRRLSQIKHLTSTGSTLDQFDYTYDGPLGRISHWGQQQPGPTAGALATNAYDLHYDAIGQLTRAVLNGDSTNLGSSVWSYDPAGNRTGIQSGSGTVSTATPTSTNSLLSLSGSGKVRIAGTLSEWAAVTVNGQSASSADGMSFEAFVALPLGTQTVTIVATDASGNAATNRYQLTITAGVGESFAYDLNGNTTALTPDGGTAQTLEVDACDRVTAINTGSHRSEFTYDGTGKRVRITEKDSGSVTSDRIYVANEERDAASGQVLRTFYSQGEQRTGGNPAGNLFYAKDHLGSLRELTDGGEAVQASYNYDVWGSRTQLQGSSGTEVGFTGYWHHQPSDLELSPTRAYHSGFGRFLSRDPIQERGDLNLYRYCTNDPIARTDPTGLFVTVIIGAIAGAVAGGVGSFINGGSPTEIGEAIAFGAVSGAIVGALPFLGFAGLLPLGLTGGLAGVVGDLLGQIFADLGKKRGCQTLNFGELAGAGIGGALAEVAGGIFQVLGDMSELGPAAALPNLYGGIVSVAVQNTPTMIGKAVGPTITF